MKLEVKKTRDDAVIPTRGHPDDAGLDLTPVDIESWISPEVALLDTGISVKPPEGYFCEVVLRSSTSKLGISLANGIGIIYPSYRGSIILPIRQIKNLISLDSLIGKRICQLLVKPLHNVDIEVVEELDDTVRGTGGFGSTNK